jgi:hypothetical protein
MASVRQRNVIVSKRSIHDLNDLKVMQGTVQQPNSLILAIQVQISQNGAGR